MLEQYLTGIVYFINQSKTMFIIQKEDKKNSFSYKWLLVHMPGNVNFSEYYKNMIWLFTVRLKQSFVRQNEFYDL